MMTNTALAGRLRAIVVPILTDLGCELYDLDLAGGVLKVTLDKAGGVDIDSIALATRLISRELDHIDPIQSRYTLEVSSPGVERSLRTPDHFRKAIGATIAVRTSNPVDNERRFNGTLASADDTGIVVTTDTGDRTMRYDQIDRARTVFEWGTGLPKGPARPRTAKSAAAEPPTQKEAS